MKVESENYENIILLRMTKDRKLWRTMIAPWPKIIW